MLDYSRLTAIKEARPLVHCVSNLVTANDCANLALAVGASPMMAQAPEEMRDVAAIAGVSVLNTGTPSYHKFQACELCGRAMAKLGKPVVLDPVGAGASRWRLKWAFLLLKRSSPAILRVNLAEARALARRGGGEHGVDSLEEAGLPDRLALADALALRYHTAVLLSGPEDVVSDGTRRRWISGGSGRMAQITGAGCMLSVLCGAFAAVTADPLEAAALASAFWKLCAQQAEARAAGQGSAAFRAALLDAASLLTEEGFAREAPPAQGS